MLCMFEHLFVQSRSCDLLGGGISIVPFSQLVLPPVRWTRNGAMPPGRQLQHGELLQLFHLTHRFD